MLLFGFTAINRALFGDLWMVPFHLMLAIGYGLVFFYTLSELRGQNKWFIIENPYKIVFLQLWIFN
jgi:hypothetical protein